MKLSNRNSIHSLMLVLSLCADCLMALPATAMAYPPSNNTVYSVRSFPATTTTRRDLTRESVSTDVQSDSDWGGIENLIVPQTKSQAEKDAEAKAQQEEETRKQAQEQAARQAQTQAIQQEEASRSAERTVITPPASKTGQAVAEYAMQFSGYPYVYGGNQPSGWDCSGFVQYVFAQFGVSLPHQSGSQMSVGSPVASLAEAQPGDILANGSHAAIYIGNGMVMNAMSPSQGTGVAPVSMVMYGSYAIRRVVWFFCWLVSSTHSSVIRRMPANVLVGESSTQLRPGDSSTVPTYSPSSSDHSTLYV